GGGEQHVRLRDVSQGRRRALHAIRFGTVGEPAAEGPQTSEGQDGGSRSDPQQPAPPQALVDPGSDVGGYSIAGSGPQLSGQPFVPGHLLPAQWAAGEVGVQAGLVLSTEELLAQIRQVRRGPLAQCWRISVTHRSPSAVRGVSGGPGPGAS